MRIVFCIVMIFWPFSTYATGEQIDVARFTLGDLSGWQTKIFSGETYYSLAELPSGAHERLIMYGLATNQLEPTGQMLLLKMYR